MVSVISYSDVGKKVGGSTGLDFSSQPAQCIVPDNQGVHHHGVRKATEK